MQRVIYIILMVSIFVSCEKEVHIPIEYSEPKLVVNSVFNTDSLWRVEISASKYIYDTMQIPLLDDATVIITDSDNNSLELINQGYGIYTSLTEKPEFGEMYTLNVSHSDYENVSSSNQLPNKVVIKDINWDEQVLFEGKKYRKVKITFQDPPENNYYSVRLYETTRVIYGDYDTGYMDSLLLLRPCYITSQNAAASNSGSKNFETSIYFTDDLFNDNEYTFDFLIENYIFEDVWEGEIKRTPLYISLSSISEELYWYETSFKKYQISNGDFFSQPVQVYTNIENGLGVFAGYSTTLDSIMIE